VRADAALADRNASVRSTARSWRKAGAIDEATLAAIEKGMPDDRVRVGPVFRVLLFFFTALAANAAFSFLWLLFNTGGSLLESAIAGASILFGIVLVGLTEFQIGRLKRSQGGTEEATSFCALGYLIAGIAWFVFEPIGDAATPLVSLAATPLLAAAAWRWGYPLYAGAATATLLACVAALPFGRALWIVLPLLASAYLVRRSESELLPPAHRNSYKAILVVGLVGLYVAVHLGSFESALVEEIGSGEGVVGPVSTSDVLWWLSVAATVIVPVVLLVIAVATRRYPFLLVGLGTAVASLVTLRYYVHLAPLWVVLTASGIALTASILLLRRFLDSGPNKERHGFTAEALFQDLARQGILEAAAAVVSLSPEARTIREELRFKGGGGEFGGGGSTTEF
jgi:hypothetical protein